MWLFTTSAVPVIETKKITVVTIEKILLTFNSYKANLVS